MKKKCFIFVAYVCVMVAAVVELSINQNDLKTKYLNNLKLSSGKEIHKPEHETKNPENNKWGENRLFRLADSDFGLVCQLSQSDFSNYPFVMVHILYSRESAYSNYKNQFEKKAISELEEHYNVKVLPAGLFVDSHLPYLVASPDGLIGVDSIIVLKLPYSANDLTSKTSFKHRKFKYLEEKSGKLFLKRTFKYYYQIQGQLHITKRKFCYFIVWTPKGMFVEKIERDDKFWQNNMESFLIKFYTDYLLPEIINPQYSLDK